MFFIRLINEYFELRQRMVVPIGRDSDGTDFVCLSCRKEFRLPKMTFYDQKTNSLMTGWCFMGSHTTSLGKIRR